MKHQPTLQNKCRKGVGHRDTAGTHFFGELYNMLAEIPEIQELHPVPDAHVPILKFKFSGVSIDLLYANVALGAIPEDLDVSEDSILENVDELTVRSLNGCRVTDQILRLVPNIQDTESTVKLHLESMEKNKAGWMTLFEPFPFFKIDIAAKNDDDLRKWKGWVESRIRQLTLKGISTWVIRVAHGSSCGSSY
ncbi:hypothetical protein HYC85_021481 [Camellia sinensis]|uniref:Poly(A) polymerase nucleotidyltransferase domain-containing protein n=1 Tax=Camellia sinensis TaxID=4442 RepID=A0A7J7GLM4_CAMSI|nr:hypothetical protein HYC85_021481 [Camellia sinensis]